MVKKIKTFMKFAFCLILVLAGYWVGSQYPMHVIEQAVDTINRSNDLTETCVEQLRDSIELNQMYREKYGSLDAAFL